MTSHRNLVATIRVSQRAGRKGPSFLSPDDQRKAILTWATAHGCRIVAWFDETDSVSGRTVDREGLNAAMAMIEQGQADGLIVAKLDRFARTVVGGLTVVAKLRGPEDGDGNPINPKRFVAAAEGIDSVGKMDPTAQLMFTVLLAIAQWQWELLKQGWDQTHDAHIERGVTAARPVYGYKKGADGKLEIVESEARVVREVFAQRERGVSWVTIAKYLDQNHPKGKGQKWVPSHLQRLTTKRAYLGEVSRGSRVNPDAHAAIVTHAQFQAVEDMTATFHKTGSEKYLLAGQVRCAVCGGRMAGSVSGKYTYYRCRKRYGWGVCPRPQQIAVKPLHDLVLPRLYALFAKPPKALVSNEDYRQAQADLERAEADLTHYLESAEVEAMRQELGDEWWEKGLRGRRIKVQESRTALAETQRAKMGVYIPANIKEDWKNLEFDEKRALLARAVPVIAVRPGDYRSPSDRVRIWTYVDDDIPTELPGLDGCRRIVAIKF